MTIELSARELVNVIAALRQLHNCESHPLEIWTGKDGIKVTMFTREERNQFIERLNALQLLPMDYIAYGSAEDVARDFGEASFAEASEFFKANRGCVVIVCKSPPIPTPTSRT
ncbi:MAG TPA: hypothetical protein VJ801_10430 [Polyangia bacterium]|jgi:hypothetical protein|nr:hypothetical protein [Polyangia bacterium]